MLSIHQGAASDLWPFQEDPDRDAPNPFPNVYPIGRISCSYSFLAPNLGFASKYFLFGSIITWKLFRWLTLACFNNFKAKVPWYPIPAFAGSSCKENLVSWIILNTDRLHKYIWLQIFRIWIFRSACKCRSIVFAFLFFLFIYFFCYFFSCSVTGLVSKISQDRFAGALSNFSRMVKGHSFPLPPPIHHLKGLGLSLFDSYFKHVQFRPFL